MGSIKQVERMITPRRGMFVVTRTSQYDDESPPVDGAVCYETRIIDRRNVDDPKKIPANHGTDGDWWKLGTNHRIENGMICRDMGWQKQWLVEIPDVMAFVRLHGDCIVSCDGSGQENIEIYDDYRE